MRYRRINQRKQPFFTHGHFVPDFGRNINKLEYFMLAKACINNVSVDLHVLKCLITPMIDLVNDLVYIIGRLLFTQFKQLGKCVSLLGCFLPSGIFRLLLIAITVTVDAINIVVYSSSTLGHLRWSPQRTCYSTLISLVVIIAASRHV